MCVDIENHDYVKRLLRAKGVTFAQIAAELSVSASLVTMVCQGHRRSDAVANAIATHVGVPTSELWPTQSAMEVHK